jgi:hypothetical protein
MKRKVIILFLTAALAASFAACGKKAAKIQTTQYSELVGIAEGSVDFADQDEPQISIKEIRSYVGEDIDYSSGIDVKNVDSYDDFQMWVDATAVDIYTVGKYTATYRFVYDGKEIEKAVSVTILDKEEEGDSINAANSGENQDNSNQGSSSQGSNGNGSSQGSGNNTGDGSGQGSGNSTGDGSGQSGNLAGNGENSNNSDNSGNSGNGDSGVPAENSAGNSGQNTGNNSGNGVQNTAGSNANNSVNGGQNTGNNGGNSNSATTASTPREIVTSKRTAATKTSTIGYTNIELLSGKYVKIKCTSAKYIVSTRTDTSQTVKNDTTYNVSKLIITYNTGAEQILETVETAVK